MAKTSQRCRSYIERTHGDDVVLKPYITALNEAARKCQDDAHKADQRNISYHFARIGRLGEADSSAFQLT